MPVVFGLRRIRDRDVIVKRAIPRIGPFRRDDVTVNCERTAEHNPASSMATRTKRTSLVDQKAGVVSPFLFPPGVKVI